MTQRIFIQRTAGRKPTLGESILGVLLLAGLIAPAALSFIVFLAVAGIAIIAAPVIRWWLRKKLERMRRQGVATPYTGPAPAESQPPQADADPVVDAEFKPVDER
ncbi:MAG: hypothetical protein V3T86_07785 [Planctomycetota bacterium]